uniref:Uncharacterized protein n=1 Tax=Panagrolaimus superbus TaxID=310955 RepID=A0A914YMQ8_9BILA
MTPKIAHGLYQPGIDKECMIKTNLFGLKVKNGVIFQYHIEFKKPKDGDKTILLFAESERKPSDYFLNRNRQLYGTLMNLFILKYPDFFIGGSDSFCYDLNHQLLSIKKLDIEKIKTGMFLTSAELPESLTYNQNVYLEVAPAGKDNSIILPIS